MGLILGCYWAVASNLTVGITQELTEGAGFAVAHQQMFGIFIFAKLAEWMKKRDEKKNRSIKQDKKLKISNYQDSCRFSMRIWLLLRYSCYFSLGSF